MENYKLTDEDCRILKEMGNSDQDLQLIQRCFDENGFELTSRAHRKISIKTAIKRIGKKEFLSGIERSLFHWSAGRGKHGDEVNFYTGTWHKNNQ